MDCSNVLNYVHEHKRMCDRYCDHYGYGCSDECPFQKNDAICREVFEITQNHIDAVQKWSDEHPEPKKETYAKYFFERFPNAKKYKAGLPIVCREYVYGVRNEGCSFSTTTCYSCWNETLPDDFYDGSTNRDK